MDPPLIERLSSRGFHRVDMPDTMEAEINGIGITAVVHPLKGLALLASGGNRDTIGFAETYVPLEASREVLRNAITRITGGILRP